MSKPKRIVKQAVVRAYEKRYKPMRCYKYVLDVTWSDKSRYVIYRSLSEFKNMQMQLFEAFPIEAGGFNSSDRIIPKLGSSSLFKRDEVQKAAEKRQHEISQYLDELIQADTKFLEFPGLLEFFEPRVDDLKGESTQTKGSKTGGIKGLFNKQKKKNKSGPKSADEFDITGPIQLESYQAIATFKANGRGQIGFQKDETIEVIDKNSNGWWYISVQGEEGWGPASYLDKVLKDGSEDDEIPCLEGERYLAVKEYTAQLEDELSFTVNVVLEVLNKVLDGWWIASYDGNVGYVPSTHLKVYKNRYLDNTNIDSQTEMSTTIQQVPRRQTIKTNGLPSKRDLQPYRRVTEKRRQRSIKHTDKSATVELGISLIPILEESGEGGDYITPTSIGSTPSVDSNSDSEYVDPEQNLEPPKHIAPSPLPRPTLIGDVSTLHSRSTSVPNSTPSPASDVFPAPPAPLALRRESPETNDGYEIIERYEYIDNIPNGETLSRSPPHEQKPKIVPRSISVQDTEPTDVIGLSNTSKPVCTPRRKKRSCSERSDSLDEMKEDLVSESTMRTPSPHGQLLSQKPPIQNRASATIKNMKVPPPPPPSSFMANCMSRRSDGSDYEYGPLDDIPIPTHKAPPPPSNHMDDIPIPTHKAPPPPSNLMDDVPMPQHDAPKPTIHDKVNHFSKPSAGKESEPKISPTAAARKPDLAPQSVDAEKPASLTKLIEKFKPTPSPKPLKLNFTNNNSPINQSNQKTSPSGSAWTEKLKKPVFPLNVHTTDKLTQKISANQTNNNLSSDALSPIQSDGKIYEETLIKPSQLKGKSNVAIRTKK